MLLFRQAVSGGEKIAMIRFKTFTTIVGAIALVVILTASPGFSWQNPMPGPMNPVPPMAAPPVPPGCGPPPGPMCGPPAPPACGPMPPPMCGPMPVQAPMGPEPNIGLEIGGRAFYSLNHFYYHDDLRGSLDIVDDLNHLADTLVGEIYGGIRLAPSLAFTYTYQFPREDFGYGELPLDLEIDDVVFAQGTRVTSRIERQAHRWELEWYPIVGCDYRVGPYMMADYYVTAFRVSDDAVRDEEIFEQFYLGLGGVAEYAAANILFLKVKAAATFLNESSGAYVDGIARYAPNTGEPGCGNWLSSIRPFMGLGYRYRTVYQPEDDNVDYTFSVHGPYAELGLVF